MNKTTLTLILLLFSIVAIAQSNCSNAQQITVSANNSTNVNVSQLTGTPHSSPCLYDNTATAQNAAWFTYTPSQNLMVTITSNTVTQNTDYYATMSLLTGNCSNLTCQDSDYVGSNGNSTNPNYYAEIEFYAQSGTTYYIYFDDLFNQLGNGSTGPFTFTVSTTTTLPAAPGIVTNPTPIDGATNIAVDPSDNNQDGNPDMSASFQWDAPTTGGSATSYDFYLSDPSSTNPTQLNLIGTISSSSANVTGLTYDDTYYWMVVAKNAGGDAVGSSTWTFTTQNDPNALPNTAMNPTPTDGATNVPLFNTTNNGQPTTGVTLQWGAPTTGGNVDGYKIFIGSDPNNLYQLNNSTNTSSSIANINYSTTYYWRIVPYNSNGDASNVITWSFTTEDNPNPLVAAINPTPLDGATNVDIFTSTNNNGNPADAIALTWEQPNTGATISNYDIYIGASPNSMQLVGNSTSTSFEVYNPAYSTTYYWGVIGYTSGGASVNSEVWSFTTEDDNTMSVNDFETNQLTHYTNNGMLVIDAETQLENVEIYSILGKKVGSEILNGNSANINIAHLQKGVYLAKVSAEGQTKTFKFIKK
tara:strand:- start:514 stop:2268 length:1755 start_codon:yes stop_codon:yes gene_type:complete